MVRRILYGFYSGAPSSSNRNRIIGLRSTSSPVFLEASWSDKAHARTGPGTSKRVTRRCAAFACDVVWLSPRVYCVSRVLAGTAWKFSRTASALTLSLATAHPWKSPDRLQNSHSWAGFGSCLNKYLLHWLYRVIFRSRSRNN